jgi:FAD/FMN-containing dehydrogenase
VILKPQKVEELASLLKSARGRIAGVDLSAFASILEHTPEDMTATVETGMTLGALQTALARHSQWLPLDPANADEVTIDEILARDLSGPRRLGFGTAREYVIGMRAVLGNGEIIRNGGKVVKNVAGYDLCRLLIGAQSTLGIVVEATFKLRPKPESEIVLQKRCDNLAEARSVAEKLGDPVALDLHNIGGGVILVAAFAGAREDVEHQETAARAAGLASNGNTEYDRASLIFRKLSILPSRIWEKLETLQNGRFIARLGNGIVYHDGEIEKKTGLVPSELMARVKKTYDPRGVLPEHSA